MERDGKSRCIAKPSVFTLIELLGGIAINGVRNASIRPGVSVAVIGLGMIGLVTPQTLKAYDAGVAVFDMEDVKLERARSLDIQNCFVSNGDGVEERALSVTNHEGFDAVIVTASTKSNQPGACGDRRTGNIAKTSTAQRKSPVEVRRKDAEMLDFRPISVFGRGFLGAYRPCW
jgi:threonine dehydrogenase-like Zn-dependent dehydrogenase